MGRASVDSLRLPGLRHLGGDLKARRVDSFPVAGGLDPKRAADVLGGMDARGTEASRRRDAKWIGLHFGRAFADNYLESSLGSAPVDSVVYRGVLIFMAISPRIA